MSVFTVTLRVARMTKAIAIDVAVNRRALAITIWRDKAPSFEVVR